MFQRYLNAEFTETDYIILVRTVLELVKNKKHYAAQYTHLIGPFDEALRRACKNNSFSELYELAALASAFQCEVQSVYPYIDYRAEMKIMNAVYKPVGVSVPNHGRLVIFWTSCRDEISTRAHLSSGVWSPNHMVPLVRQRRNYQTASNEQARAISVVEYQIL